MVRVGYARVSSPDQGTGEPVRHQGRSKEINAGPEPVQIEAMTINVNIRQVLRGKAGPVVDTISMQTLLADLSEWP